MYEHLEGVVKAAGFYYEDELKTIREADKVAVEYGDDRFDFGVACTDRHIRIVRRGSRLSNFHEWYWGFMPSAQGVLTTVASILTDELHRKVDVQRAAFQFHFVIHDLRDENTSTLVRNSAVMRKLLKGFPDDRGMITDNPNVVSSLGRVDVNLSRFVGEPGRRRRLRFGVEAPANLEYSTLWFSFSYGGESYTEATTGKREGFDPNVFLSEYEQAYVGFLRDCALTGFLEWLMRGYTFKSSSGNLP
jgi:hypothetical protein